ncbi:cAMP-specific 3',5'-cyclic phosphodiesterase 4D [Borealophlyctis nickersoniae]|nr:cAMP-specific 3',5'-cyclic phosphodiesterase 4D [Borealophlyctis nickersoniae]
MGLHQMDDLGHYPAKYGDYSNATVSATTTGMGSQIGGGPHEGHSSAAPDHSFGTVMDTHLEKVTQRRPFNKWTLAFRDPSEEQAYRRYFLDRTLSLWQTYALVAIIILTALEAVLITQYSQPRQLSTPLQDFLLVGAGGVIPLCILFTLTYIIRKDILSNYIHLISLLFFVILGPIVTCGRAFFQEPEAYPSSFTAPIYIFELVSSIFFCRIRFVYTIACMCIAIPTWFGVFGSGLSKLDGTVHGHVRPEFAFASTAMGLASIVICSIAYNVERNFRMQYLSDQRFLSINIKLKKQLKGLQKSYVSRIADFDSPLEKAIWGLKWVMASPYISAEHLKTLDMVMHCLNSPNLLTPDLDQQVQRGQVEVDDEQEQWLFNEIARRQAVDTSSETTVSLHKFHPHLSSTAQTPNASTDALLPANSFSSTTTMNHTTLVNGDSPPPSPSFASIEGILSPEVGALLQRVPEYNFPIFEFAEATGGHPLLVLSHHLVVRSGVLARLGLPEGKFVNFMRAVEGGYNPDLPFHNSLHAADVLHCMHHLSSNPRLANSFSDIDLLSIYLAASIHDYDHPGVNNHFLISTADSRALLYNDKSVLENHHCAAAFEVLLRDDCNFLKGVETKTWRRVRESVVDMVLATDLAQHFSLLTMFKKKVLTGDEFDPVGSREDRGLMMQMLMKCSDVSNPTKSWPLYSEWISRITQEFFMQGDREKALGLPVSPFCNRDGANATNPTSSQKSFIEFIVAPLFEAFGAWCEVREVKEGLEASRVRFSGAPPPQAVAPSATTTTSTSTGSMIGLGAMNASTPALSTPQTSLSSQSVHQQPTFPTPPHPTTHDRFLRRNNSSPFLEFGRTRAGTPPPMPTTSSNPNNPFRWDRETNREIPFTTTSSSGGLSERDGCGLSGPAWIRRKGSCGPDLR